MIKEVVNLISYTPWC